ncbi:cellulase family glycosylhydrolase [Nocardioides stalactiti]|uniref:cellulase family glycosylhydrolase n=1 Tax=Nocardioides stalactiti TaxID=2755356 RepID=UPI0015FFD765|nr:cellulase family glycosylhydrolase [Nocardioides stalactiti]
MAWARRAVVVLLAAVLAVWVLGSTRPQQINALPDRPPVEMTPTTTEEQPTAPPERRPGPDRRLGVQLSAHHGSDPRPALRVMDRLAAAGARWLRVDVGWRTLQEHGRGPFQAWYVDLIDTVLKGAHDRNLKVIFNLWQTPAWASRSGSAFAPPRNPATYAHAIGLAAQMWATEVDAWEVWNEPNFEAFFEGANPTRYTRMLCAAYPAVKQHDGSPVLMGGLMYNDDVWLEKTYQAGSKPCFDALATHPYLGPSDAAPGTPAYGEVWRLTHTPAMRSVMVAWGDADKKVWITELGWSSGPDNMGNPWDRPVTKRRQARYLGEAVDLIRNDYPYVGPIIWYRDIDGHSASYQDGFGLLHPDLSGKPAYRAFKAAVRNE